MRLKRCAAQPAAIASNTDFSKMAGSTAGSGIPNNNELDIDILSEKIKEANEIIAFCTEKLTKADREVEKLLQERRQSE